MKKKYLMPAEDVNDETAIISAVYFKSKDLVKRGDLIYSFETTKAVIDVSCDEDGYINYHVNVGDDIPIGALVCEVAKDLSEFQLKIKETKENKLKYKPTKKALKFAEKHNLVLEDLELEGIVRENDLIPFVEEQSSLETGERIKKLNKSNKFIISLLENKEFRLLSSNEKIRKYREAGYVFSNKLFIGDNSIIIANKINIEEDVFIGNNTYIEAHEVFIGCGSKIGNDCEMVASQIRIGPMNNIANKVNVDISGGRHIDSNFKTGKGCLIASEAYINVSREVTIGENVALSPRSMIYTHSYWQSVLDGYSSNFGPVHLEDNSWLGSVAQIMPNVVVGKDSIVMSNSLAITNVKPGVLVGGVPAEIIKEEIKKKLSISQINQVLFKLFNELSSWFHMNHGVVNKLNANLYNLKYEEEQKTLFFYYPENEDIPDLDKFEIVLTLSKPSDLSIEYDSMFLIEEKKFIGSLGKIELMLLNFFRRKGIRFYDK